MDKVLVTGGAGFVGSGLVRLLHEHGYQVVVFDNLSAGTVENLPRGSGLEVIRGELSNAEDVDRALATRPDKVVHLAALHYIPYCTANPAETLRVNVLGTQRLLDGVERFGDAERLVFASSAAVYAPSSEACAETDLVAPIDIYGISKRFGEEILDLFAQRSSVACASARIFNVVGPRETNPHLLPDIIEQLHEGATEVTLGNLIPKRDYIYVDDVARGILTLLENVEARGPYNIGGGRAYDAVEVVETMGTILGRDIRVHSDPQRQREGDRPYLSAKTSKLQSLGWRCEVDWEDAVRLTLEHYAIA